MRGPELGLAQRQRALECVAGLLGVTKLIVGAADRQSQCREPMVTTTERRLVNAEGTVGR